MPVITKAALLLFQDNVEKELLFVRPYDSPYYLLPGGKQEEGETIEAALDRELQEELRVSAINAKSLGTVTGETPDGRELRMHLFVASIKGEPVPSSEIENIEWMTKDTVVKNREYMTPMTLNHILPFLAEQKIWP